MTAWTTHKAFFRILHSGVPHANGHPTSFQGGAYFFIVHPHAHVRDGELLTTLQTKHCPLGVAYASMEVVHSLHQLHHRSATVCQPLTRLQTGVTHLTPF